jgi:hypothetical protein
MFFLFFFFFQVLHSIIVRRGSEDRLWWVSPNKGLFTVGSFFSSLACSVGSYFPWKSVWWTWAPSRTAFFVWSVTLDKILTMDNLRKKHVILLDRCCMCRRNGESVDHLLLYCDVAYALWSAIFTRFGLFWVMPKRILDLFACWWTSGRSRSAVIWKMVPVNDISATSSHTCAASTSCPDSSTRPDSFEDSFKQSLTNR